MHCALRHIRLYNNYCNNVFIVCATRRKGIAVDNVHTFTIHGPYDVDEVQLFGSRRFSYIRFPYTIHLGERLGNKQACNDKYEKKIRFRDLATAILI